MAEQLALRYYPPLVCAHVAGEFLFGLNKARAAESKMRKAREFLDSFEFILPSRRTIETYGSVRGRLENGGFKMSDPDYWIAAHALDERLHLLTTDKDFLRVPGLFVHYLDPSAN